MSADTPSGGHADKGHKPKKSKHKDREKGKEKKRKNDAAQHKPTTPSSIPHSSSDAPPKSSSGKSSSKSKHSSSKTPTSANADSSADQSFSILTSSTALSNVSIEIREGSASPVSKSTSPLLISASRAAVALSPASLSAADTSCLGKFRNMSPLRLIMFICLFGGFLFMFYTNFFYEGWVGFNAGGVFDVNRLFNANEQDAQLHDYTKINTHVPHETKKKEEILTPIDTSVSPPTTESTTTPASEPNTPVVVPDPTTTSPTTENNGAAQPEPVAPTNPLPENTATPSDNPPAPSPPVTPPAPVVVTDPTPTPSSAKPVSRFKDIRLSTLAEKVLETGEGVRDFFSLDLESWYTKIYGEHQMFDRQEAEMRELKIKELHRRMKERIFQRPSDTKREKETATTQSTYVDGNVVTSATRTFRPRPLVDPGALERARLAKEAQVAKERIERANAREAERIKQQQQQLQLQQQLKIPASAELPFKLTINNLANQPAASIEGQPKEFGAS